MVTNGMHETKDVVKRSSAVAHILLYIQGALLMVLFESSHVLEHKLTDQAQGNLQALFDATPEHATLVQLKPDKSPDMAKLQNAKARDVAVGSNMLIRPGQQVPHSQSWLQQC